MSTSRLITRRRFLIASAATAAASLGGLAYTHRAEPRWLDVSQRSLSLPAGTWSGPPLRVVHLSDLHYSSTVPLSLIDRAVTLTLRQKPDLVCITGDFVTENDDFDLGAYATVLSRLSKACPTFATLGNHDSPIWIRRGAGPNRIVALLEQAGIPLLHNRSFSLPIRDRRVHLVGVGDLWQGECNPRLAFKNFSPSSHEPILALCHNPDAKDLFHQHPWHALLCGHTHGGQCGLPVLGAAIAPVRDKRFLRGAYRYENRWLHITRGVGTLFGVRLFCRPEISTLDFS